LEGAELEEELGKIDEESTCLMKCALNFLDKWRLLPDPQF
jgi:hypothetical protein